MKILVISDSHGKTRNIHRIILKEKKLDAIIHLGDEYNDYLEIKDCYDIPAYGVIGNVDYKFEGPSVDVLELNNYKILICHGHNYRVKESLEILRYKAKSVSAVIALYGHSHKPYIEEDDIFILNPGSVSEPRSERYPSYAILELNDNSINGEIIPII